MNTTVCAHVQVKTSENKERLISYLRELSPLRKSISVSTAWEMLREWKLNEQQRKKITSESKYEESP